MTAASIRGRHADAAVASEAVRGADGKEEQVRHLVPELEPQEHDIDRHAAPHQ